MNFEYSLSGKWLELLKQIAPGVTRAAILRDPGQGSGNMQFASIQALAPSLGVEVNPIKRAMRARSSVWLRPSRGLRMGGLIVTSGASMVRHRNLTIALAARYKLPAVYSERFYAAPAA
jgi:putative ABC transport system substrate-binding protein